MSASTSNLPLGKLNVLSAKGVQMRTFHIAWLSFFVCFFGWFGLAPLMPTIKADLHLSKEQIGNIMIASVSSTIIARLIIGKLCDTWGPRKAHTLLLLIGSIPVFLVGLAHSYTSFLLFRLCIGVIGASFVITQIHTSAMFQPQLKGTANAITGGWGNLGGGVTNMVMPLIFAAIVAFGFTDKQAWRYAMIIPGIMMVIMAYFNWKFTADTPAGNLSQLESTTKSKQKTDYTVLLDWRIWALALAYACCFGMEITFDNVAALHFVEKFGLSQSSAGFWAGTFGLMNIFARALGGIFSDKVGKVYGMRGKGLLLAAVLLIEGIGLMLFAKAGSFGFAIGSMIFFALFLKISNGATYGITPFINPKNSGLVAGIVGAGGNVGGMAFGFLFKNKDLSYSEAFGYIGLVVIAISCIVFITRFTKREVADLANTDESLQKAIA